MLSGSCADVPADEVPETLGERSEALITGTALLISSSAVLTSADTAVRNRLQGLGLSVTVKADSVSAAADATGKALVVISSTVTAPYVGTKFRDVNVPVVTWESQLYDDLGMTTTSTLNYGTSALQRNLAISATTHPIASGLSGTVAVTSASSTFNWGKPNANAVKVAALATDSTRAGVFAYDTGASMPGRVAPARRVALFLGDTSASVLTASGWKLFDQAINWAAGSNGTPGDADGDRLPDSAETNTNVFVNAQNTGTNPNNRDTDGDGISDGDEVLGTTAGLNLPALGVSPLRKNILIEHDWFSDANDCAAHSHRPTPAALALLTTAFANAPVSNPDGSSGISVIQDYGQGGLFTGGNAISDANGAIEGDVLGSEFQNYKQTHLAANRVGFFHYTLHVHLYTGISGSSGNAEITGDDLMVSLQCSLIDQYIGFTLMHELGHNLGLLHGGNDNFNLKPNYNSIMNYQYQFVGVDTDCVQGGDGVLDFSRNQRIVLNENALRETAGICGSPGIDWNNNGAISSDLIQADINSDNQYSVLNDHNDWAAVKLAWQPAGGVARSAQQQIYCDNPPPPVR